MTDLTDFPAEAERLPLYEGDSSDLLTEEGKLNYASWTYAKLSKLIDAKLNYLAILYREIAQAKLHLQYLNEFKPSLKQ